MAGHLGGFKRRRRLVARDLTATPSAAAIPFAFHGNKSGGRDSDSDDDGDDDKSSSKNKQLDDSDSKKGGDNDNNNNGNSKDSGSDNGGGGGNNNNNSGNSQSCGSGIVPFFGHACSYINDNDPRLKYSNGWKLESGDPNGHTTIHTTTQTSATVGFSFNGSWIGVFGTISPGSNPPTANYTLDKGTPDPIRETPVQKCFPGQPLFSTPPGLPLGSHNLTIEVVKVDDDTPYILDQIVVCSIPPPPPNHSQQSTSTSASTSTTAAVSVNQSAPADTERTGVRPIDGIIIGSVLGAVFLLIAIGLLVWRLIQRRRKRLARLRCLHIAASPVSSWIFRQNSQSGTVFTSTESIMRDNPTDSSSVVPDSPKRRAMSMPPSVSFAPDPPEKYLRPPSGVPSRFSASPSGLARSPSSVLR